MIYYNRKRYKVIQQPQQQKPQKKKQKQVQLKKNPQQN